MGPAARGEPRAHIITGQVSVWGVGEEGTTACPAAGKRVILTPGSDGATLFSRPLPDASPAGTQPMGGTGGPHETVNLPARWSGTGKMSQTSAETGERRADGYGSSARRAFEIRIIRAGPLFMRSTPRSWRPFSPPRREPRAARGPPASRELHPLLRPGRPLRQCTPPHRLRCFGTRASRAGNASVTSVLRRSPAGPWFRPISFLRSGLPPPALRRGSPRATSWRRAASNSNR